MDDVLAEQVAYYRARAGEYDRWFLRQGRYDRGAEATAAWFAEVEEVRRALDAVPLDGVDVLELAAGTGLWTEHLVRRTAEVVAVDASPEVLAVNRERLGADAGKVRFVEADVFAWRPERPAGAVVFCFWISHVPDERLDDFLAGVADSVRPGAPVFFVDNRRASTSTAVDHRLPDGDDEVMERRLDDGRSFRVVKRFRAGADLEDRCRAAGLHLQIHETATYFQYGVGRRAD